MGTCDTTSDERMRTPIKKRENEILLKKSDAASSAKYYCGVDNELSKYSGYKSNNGIVIERQNNTTVIKNLNQINGQNLTISECKNCTIMIMDHSSTTVVQNCEDSSLFLGVCMKSIEI